MVKLDTLHYAHLRSILMLMRVLLFILAASACGEPNDSADDTTRVAGDAFGIRIQPIHPPNQEGMFDEADILELVVQQQDGETTTHTSTPYPNPWRTIYFDVLMSQRKN